ncbi:MAG TPA: alanine racemase [Muricauda sp.]|uniref:Alanine racemase n=1 Tax=Flagellimonas aurea TaxID=2915619 RepID=A0ABS3FZV7_9FLAO|nr:alanine racemase [Allomuricauda aurea]MBC74158.1 alanine racemase [Allomuricauda sp.]MBO0352660.1 alanine racemase [Allomuricauda aurea]UBZ15664.1 alanine racemase [Allomuricauda aquimarina]HBU76795.1 alanine racemase [Allomuricauda sp.]|tara:strand:+ start:1781 stop:2890 length:1110 start_codon:yes stop_codon:yes gene_type:complete
MSKVGETTLTLNLLALEHNYNYLRAKIEPETKFLGVVKAFAYGSDTVTIARKLEQLGADYLAVAYVSEGVLLREAGIQLPILVLHPLASNFEDLIAHHLEPSLYSRNILNRFLEAANAKNQKDYPIHIKFNTGLNRLGFSEADVNFIAEETKRSECIRIVSCFSHLAASEDINERDFSLNQIASFKNLSGALMDTLGYAPMRHMLNTSGILNYPEAQFEMVRSGIGLYGYGNQAKVDEQLRPVASLKTIISQIHEIGANQSVGYNRAFKSSHNIKSATLPIGHADGIGRQYGKGKGFVTINGKKAPILGNVCMDMIMVDVTEIDCKEGDEAIVFGPNKSAENFAATANTISYEILTAISQRVKREVINT